METIGNFSFGDEPESHPEFSREQLLKLRKDLEQEQVTLADRLHLLRLQLRDEAETTHWHKDDSIAGIASHILDIRKQLDLINLLLDAGSNSSELL